MLLCITKDNHVLLKEVSIQFIDKKFSTFYICTCWKTPETYCDHGLHPEMIFPQKDNHVILKEEIVSMNLPAIDFPHKYSGAAEETVLIQKSKVLKLFKDEIIEEYKKNKKLSNRTIIQLITKLLGI